MGAFRALSSTRLLFIYKVYAGNNAATQDLLLALLFAFSALAKTRGSCATNFPHRECDNIYIPKFDSWNGTRIMMCTRGTDSRTVDAISHSFAAARPSHLSGTLSRWAPQRAQSIKDIAIYRGIERKRAYTCTTDMELGNALNCDSSLSFPSYVDIEFWTSFDKSDLFPSYWPRAITHLLVGREHSSPYSNILRNCDEHFAYVY